MNSVLRSVVFCVKFQFKKEQTNINCLRFLIQNNFRNKRNLHNFYLESKLNQVSVVALPDWRLLLRV